MDTDLDVADESPVQVPLVPESAINFTLNAVTAPSSSIEEIPRGPATPAPAARSAETTSVLLGAPSSAAPLCAQNKGAPPSAASLPHPPPPAPLAPGFSAPIPPRAHHVFLPEFFVLGTIHRSTQLLCLRAATQIPRSAWIRQRTSFGLLAPEPSPYQP